MKRWEQKELVQSLRRQGLSYREILARVPFSLARTTISAWCRDIELTPEQFDRLDRLCRGGNYRGRLLGPKTIQRRRREEVEAIKATARAEVGRLFGNELWLAGLMLYWAEGSKSHSVAVTNSDPGLMRLMMRWFREVCCVPEEKFRVQLHLHSGQDESSMKTFWSGILGIPVHQFTKSYMKQEGTGHRKNVLYHGTVRVQFYNENLLQKILGWIDGIGDFEWAASSTGRAGRS